MFEAKLTLNTGKVLAEIKAKSWDGVRRAIAFLWQKCLEAVGVSSSRPWSAPTPPGNRTPGEPPKKRTGFGQRSILYELDERNAVGRVGVAANAKYMAFLDRGTRKMAARPWLVATLTKFWTTIKGLAEAG